MKYKHKVLTNKQADKILEKWGKASESCYAENNSGTVNWNQETGEILWYSFDGDNTNGEFLN